MRVVFGATTRYAKWAVVAVERDSGEVRIEWYKHAELQCVQMGLDREAARDSLAETLAIEKYIDRIDYCIVEKDELGVKELIP